ncbi:MAG: PHP domain-containing protein [Halobacteriaceae archaeon]
MSVYADLHVHTTASDGSLALADVPAAAREAGVRVVGVTDHDRVHPGLEAPVAVRDGVTVVRGVELRVESDAGRVDLLGYGVRETAALSAELDRIQRDRVERARRMVARVEDRLGVSLDVPFEHGVGRPHVARAVADATGESVQWAFDELLGDDRPCYVARDVPGFDEGVSLLAGACPLVALAHPLRYPNPDAALALAADLDAVELYYPYGGDPDLAPVRRALREHDCVPTGGSDAHDRRLGLAGLDAVACERVRDRLRDPPDG